ncbi:mandelate racemase/muconate lactonizing enzyme family protein [Mycobacterium sp. 050128]|uniref:mandelate racemase/muconate lactonizing enzyme family protein n=1 Tax=Mycobacterium sp. 050128 TaxID=3096112 RepID=UPI002ED9EE70
MTVTDATVSLTTEPALLASHVVLVESRHLAIPTGVRSFLLPDGRWTPTDLPAVVIRVTDDDGVQGFSLLWFQRSVQALPVEAALRNIANEVSNHVLSDLAGIDRAIRGATTFLGTQGVNAFAASGLKMAVEDLVCRRRNASLADILGRTRDRVRAYRTGLMLDASVDELIEEAAASHARGVRAMKMIVGKPTIDEDVDRIQAVRSSLPADTTLMVDALQRWHCADTALLAAERFSDFDLRWIEDPLAHGDRLGYRSLAQRSPVPIATGEALFTRADLDGLLVDGIRYLVGEPERVGGLCAWKNIAEAAHDSGAAMLPHLYPHVSAQLLATLRQEEVWLEYVPWFDALVVEELALSADGTFEVGSAAGSGFTPCPDGLERFACGSWHRLTC